MQKLRQRPWYLSLSLVWDDASGLNELNEALGKTFRLPCNQILVPQESRHCTAFAIVQINGVPAKGDSLQQFGRELMSQLEPIVRNDLSKAWRKSCSSDGLTLTASKLRVFDDGTTVQFARNEELSEFRDRVRGLLMPIMGNLIGHYPEGLAESMIHDCPKSRGPEAWGSIARSPCRSDGSELRWEARLKLIPVKFKKVHLLVSDHAMTNPREPMLDDHLIS
jgi:hypothetical protein